MLGVYFVMQRVFEINVSGIINVFLSLHCYVKCIGREIVAGDGT
jgi:hypothetical protein